MIISLGKKGNVNYVTENSIWDMGEFEIKIQDFLGKKKIMI